jgi:uncharacterized membrane protein
VSGAPVILGILLLGVATFGFKAVGPLTASDRVPPPLLARIAEVLPVALIAGLVVTQTFDQGPDVTRIAGVVAAAIAVAFRAPFAVVVLVGAGCAAVMRALGLG